MITKIKKTKYSNKKKILHQILIRQRISSLDTIVVSTREIVIYLHFLLISCQQKQNNSSRFSIYSYEIEVKEGR
jgi:hypothetical protein